MVRSRSPSSFCLCPHSRLCVSTRPEVHKVYDNYVCGRSKSVAGPNDTVGIALTKVVSKTRDAPVFLLVTYKLPHVSSEIVPELLEFAQKNMTEL